MPLTALLGAPDPALTDLLNTSGPAVAALVGGGGKTSLMFALAHALRQQGRSVISTTTTRIFPPQDGQTGQLLLFSPDLSPAHDGTSACAPSFFPDTPSAPCAPRPPRAVDTAHAPPPSAAFWQSLRTALALHGHITVAAGRLPDGKLAGLSVAQVDALIHACPAHTLLVEADGSAMRPFKAPAAHEPAVPPQTTLCLALCGLDGMGRALNQAAHRPELAAALCACPPNAPMRPEHAARLLLHPQGLFRTCPPHARRVALCHKADLPGGLDMARAMARAGRALYPGGKEGWWAGSALQGWALPLE